MIFPAKAAAVLDGLCFATWTGVSPPQAQRLAGISIPAADYCASVGGRNVTRRDCNGGEVAFCQLPNGRSVDTWTLYRQAVQRAGERSEVTRYCTAMDGRLLPNDDGTHGWRTREGDVFGA